MKSEIYVECDSKQINTKQLIDEIKEIWKSEERLVKDISTMDIYYKPQENMCYYVINEEVNGKFIVNK